MNFASADIYRCRKLGHHFRMVGSDKTPMRRSLVCVTCTDKTGVSTFVAYPDNDPSNSWGVWRRPVIHETEDEQ